MSSPQADLKNALPAEDMEDNNTFSKPIKMSEERKHWNMWGLMKCLATKESTVEFCKEQGLIATGPICKWCRRLLRWSPTEHRGDGFSWRCNSRRCKKRTANRSVRHSSWFAGSRLSLEKVLVLTYCWAVGMTNKVAVRESSISGTITCGETVVEWFNYCREVCLHAVRQCSSKAIGGPELVVEIGESKFGKQKFNKSRNMKGKWVLGGICRKTRDVFFIEIDNREPATVISLIKEYVAPGSTLVITDCWQSYDCFSADNFKDLNVYHTVKFMNPPTGALTRNAESQWTQTKRKLLGSSTSSCGGFGLYLAEYIWRRKNRDRDPFQQILDDILLLYKPPKRF
ncbi:uncharacterized protein LOC119745298 isoform X2 [Patiria miniata]|uniref:ISXO2-like transposase domain-containing protein n=1 Tax=Patiria miniata TaxID=46514 RepID=A0A914BPR4_PATMI|nr:uncharacterized protein LOC119745298 isoform X2 [Patiria miniata]